MNVWLVLGVGVLVHFIFFISVFEIFFSTPLMNGMTPHSSRLKPPAKRVVFIIADGLRADKVLELSPNGQTPAPYLRSIIENKGAWGISHAAVPTATRPGHVALTAGFYEDPTSVAKDIQGKTVQFDTVFNESRYTWSWDTPKFLAKITGGNADRMYSKKYPGHMKWLAGINPADMDSWVLKESLGLFEEAKSDEALKTRMNSDQIMFFLHLGGLDHSGYIVRPNSEAYRNHITMVDEGIKKFVQTLEAFYENDGQTSFVFSSDHGMTDWGAHGDGTPDETLTPLIAWGPGIREPETETVKFPDGLSETWKITRKRTDIKQASVAPFLAALVGIPYPMNSITPVPDHVFNITDHERSEMLYANLRQLAGQYEAMRDERKRNSMKMTFSPYEQLPPEAVPSMLYKIDNLIADKKYTEAIDACRVDMVKAMAGIRYYQTYDRSKMWMGIFISYIGWMVYILTIVLEEHTANTSSTPVPQLSRRIRGMIVASFSLLSVVIFTVLYVESAVWTNYLYIMLPCPIWMAIFLRMNIIRQLKVVASSLKPMLPYFLLTFVGLEAIVLSYYHRLLVFPVMYICIGLYPWLMKSQQLEKRVLFQWLASCFTVAFFPSLPAGGRELNYDLVVFGGVLVMAVACFLVKRFATKQLARRKLFLVFSFQISVIAICIFIVRHTAQMAATNQRTPLVSQVLSWTFLGLANVEPFLVTTDIRCRLLTVAMAWIAPFILFCISYELLYVLAMCWNLYIWMMMEASFTDNYKELPSNLKILENGNGVNGKGSPEHNSKFLESMDFATITNQMENGKARQSMVPADLRRAFYFVFMVNTSVFGIGNVASVNSFDCAAVFSFLTISNPPFMGLLLTLKIIIPFIFVACTLRAINLVTHAPLKSAMFLALFLSDVAALHFFLLVTDSGTWMHVGMTVSHYVIYQIVNMVIMCMFFLAYLFTTCNICCWPRSKL